MHANFGRDVFWPASACFRAIALGVVLSLLPNARAWALASGVRMQGVQSAKAPTEEAAPSPASPSTDTPAQAANPAPAAQPQSSAGEPQDPKPAATPQSTPPATANAQMQTGSGQDTAQPPPPVSPARPAGPAQLAAADPEPKFRGVGLMIGGGLIGSAAIYPALFGGMMWLVFPSDELVQAEPGNPVSEGRRSGRKLFLFGVAGLIVGGAMLTGGVILHQKHQAWRERSLRAANRRQARVIPWHQWNGRSHRFGIAARF